MASFFNIFGFGNKDAVKPQPNAPEIDSFDDGMLELDLVVGGGSQPNIEKEASLGARVLSFIGLGNKDAVNPRPDVLPELVLEDFSEDEEHSSRRSEREDRYDQNLEQVLVIGDSSSDDEPEGFFEGREVAVKPSTSQISPNLSFADDFTDLDLNDPPGTPNFSTTPARGQSNPPVKPPATSSLFDDMSSLLFPDEDISEAARFPLPKTTNSHSDNRGTASLFDFDGATESDEDPQLHPLRSGPSQYDLGILDVDDEGVSFKGTEEDSFAGTGLTDEDFQIVDSAALGGAISVDSSLISGEIDIRGTLYNILKNITPESFRECVKQASVEDKNALRAVLQRINSSSFSADSRRLSLRGEAEALIVIYLLKRHVGGDVTTSTTGSSSSYSGNRLFMSSEDKLVSSFVSAQIVLENSSGIHVVISDAEITQRYEQLIADVQKNKALLHQEIGELEQLKSKISQVLKGVESKARLAVVVGYVKAAVKFIASLTAPKEGLDYGYLNEMQLSSRLETLSENYKNTNASGLTQAKKDLENSIKMLDDLIAYNRNSLKDVNLEKSVQRLSQLKVKDDHIPAELEQREQQQRIKASEQAERIRLQAQEQASDRAFQEEIARNRTELQGKIQSSREKIYQWGQFRQGIVDLMLDVTALSQVEDDAFLDVAEAVIEDFKTKMAPSLLGGLYEDVDTDAAFQAFFGEGDVPDFGSLKASKDAPLVDIQLEIARHFESLKTNPVKAKEFISNHLVDKKDPKGLLARINYADKQIGKRKQKMKRLEGEIAALDRRAKPDLIDRLFSVFRSSPAKPASSTPVPPSTPPRPSLAELFDFTSSSSSSTPSISPAHETSPSSSSTASLPSPDEVSLPSEDVSKFIAVRDEELDAARVVNITKSANALIHKLEDAQVNYPSQKSLKKKALKLEAMLTKGMDQLDEKTKRLIYLETASVMYSSLTKAQQKAYRASGKTRNEKNVDRIEMGRMLFHSIAPKAMYSEGESAMSLKKRAKILAKARDGDIRDRLSST
jgi:hypothetical protein